MERVPCTPEMILRNPWMEAVKQVAGQPEYGSVPTGVAARYLSPYWREFRLLPIDERIQRSVAAARDDLLRDIGPRVGPYSKVKKSPTCRPSSPRTPPRSPVSPLIRPTGIEMRPPSEIDRLQPEIDEELISDLPSSIVQEIQQGSPVVTGPRTGTNPPRPRGQRQLLPPLPSVGRSFTLTTPSGAEELVREYRTTYNGGNVSSTGRVSVPSNLTINNNV